MTKISRYTVEINLDDGRSVLWNTVSGGLLLLDKKAQSWLESVKSLPDSSTYYNQLNNSGFIVEDEKDEYAQLVLDEFRATHEYGRTLRVVIIPGLGCNFRCSYCFEREGGYSANPMTPDTAGVICSYLESLVQDANSLEEISITWFGGEPTLYVPTIEYISNRLIKYCSDKSLRYSARMVTNARLLDISCLGRLIGCQVSKYQITLDGLRSSYDQVRGVEPGTFDIVLRNLTAAAKRADVSVRINTNGSNEQEITDLFDVLFGKNGPGNAASYYFAPIYNYEVSDQANIYKKVLDLSARIVERVGEKYPGARVTAPQRRRVTSCALIREKALVIGPRGELYRCEHDAGNDSKTIGQIPEGLFATNYEKEYYEIEHNKECTLCVFFPLCLGGCKNDQIMNRHLFDCADRARYFIWQECACYGFNPREPPTNNSVSGCMSCWGES